MPYDTDTRTAAQIRAQKKRNAAKKKAAEKKQQQKQQHGGIQAATRNPQKKSTTKASKPGYGGIQAAGLGKLSKPKPSTRGMVKGNPDYPTNAKNQYRPSYGGIQGATARNRMPLGQRREILDSQRGYMPGAYQLGSLVARTAAKRAAQPSFSSKLGFGGGGGSKFGAGLGFGGGNPFSSGGSGGGSAEDLLAAAEAGVTKGSVGPKQVLPQATLIDIAKLLAPYNQAQAGAVKEADANTRTLNQVDDQQRKSLALMGKASDQYHASMKQNMAADAAANQRELASYDDASQRDLAAQGVVDPGLRGEIDARTTASQADAGAAARNAETFMNSLGAVDTAEKASRAGDVVATRSAADQTLRQNLTAVLNQIALQRTSAESQAEAENSNRLNERAMAQSGIDSEYAQAQAAINDQYQSDLTAAREGVMGEISDAGDEALTRPYKGAVFDDLREYKKKHATHQAADFVQQVLTGSGGLPRPENADVARRSLVNLISLQNKLMAKEGKDPKKYPISWMTGLIDKYFKTGNSLSPTAMQQFNGGGGLWG